VSQLLKYLQGRQQAMIDTLERLVMLDSPSSDREAVNAAGAFLADAFGALEARVERLPETAYGDHLRVTWGEGSRQVLLLGHMDTVWPANESQQRPFRAVADEPAGSLTGTGPGIFDMKGGLVIGMYAMAALRELGMSPAQAGLSDQL
jgi:glutamate carboxypeptidase